MSNTNGKAVAALYAAVNEKAWKEKEYIPSMQEIVPETIYHNFSIDDEVAWLQTNYALAFYRPLNSNRILGSILILLRKVIRKVLAFLILPIACDQSSYNEHIATTMRKMEIELSDQKSMIEDLNHLADKLKRKLEGENSEDFSGN